jgi:hypothetical protein
MVSATPLDTPGEKLNSEKLNSLPDVEMQPIRTIMIVGCEKTSTLDQGKTLNDRARPKTITLPFA